MIRFFKVIVWNLPRIYMIPRMEYKARHTERYGEEARYAYARLAIRRMMRAGHIYTKCYGTENLPKEGGYLLCPNHQGKYDALGIMISHDAPCSVVIDDARSHGLLVKQFIDLVQGKRLKKGDARQSMKIIKELAEDIKNGRRFIIFPEGGYYHNHNTVGEFKPGCFKSAVRAKVPIVPVALIDSYRVFEEWSLKRVETQVHFLRAIPYEEYRGMTTAEIAALVKERIVGRIDEALCPT
ncbi:MAG: 1-acyl-sn-glycerol-3-phosphate acyltransferase [Bacteroidales bacterium]|nr:1-acyl-sn-glycerol-3-phosphate acyltransferase [Bacteroidales bacterium]MCM1415212.1 1-acyl-sn-glycerol-3-phosphate acyltransferase [bacterium]MCM1423794.1 1-acyl-sn-glycerol-3-phosphate acyltransferase [bacterium]